DGNLHAASAALHGARDRLLHRSPECYAALQLVRYGAGDEVSVQLRLANLDDVHPDPAVGHFLQLAAQLIDLLAAAADNDAGLRGVDGHDDLVGIALELYARDSSVRELLQDVPAHTEVLMQKLCVVLVRVPLALPGVDDAEAVAYR